jgi:hypothetical protein
MFVFSEFQYRLLTKRNKKSKYQELCPKFCSCSTTCLCVPFRKLATLRSLLMWADSSRVIGRSRGSQVKIEWTERKQVLFADYPDQQWDGIHLSSGVSTSFAWLSGRGDTHEGRLFLHLQTWREWLVVLRGQKQSAAFAMRRSEGRSPLLHHLVSTIYSQHRRRLVWLTDQNLTNFSGIQSHRLNRHSFTTFNCTHL